MSNEENKEFEGQENTPPEFGTGDSEATSPQEGTANPTEPETPVEAEQAKPTTLEDLDIDEIKEKAQKRGISIRGNVSKSTLIARIQDHDKAEKADNANRDKLRKEIEEKTGVAIKDESPGQRKARMRKEAKRLVRVQIQCLNPAKKNWPGEIVTVMNSFVGTIRKYVPFQNTENGYHIPEMLYKALKNRKYRTTVKTGENKHGIEATENKLVPEFQLILLPPLTEEELEKLAQEQRAAQGL